MWTSHESSLSQEARPLDGSHCQPAVCVTQVVCSFLGHIAQACAALGSLLGWSRIARAFRWPVI